MPPVVTGSGTLFRSEIARGDKVEVTPTPGGAKYVRTVISIADDTHLTVDSPFLASGTGLTMRVRPSIITAEDADKNLKFEIDDQGFIGLAGSTINGPSQEAGIVVCKADVVFTDPNQEMRGYQSTMNYVRTTRDTADGTNKDGWDVFGYGGAVVLEGMNLPSNIGTVNTSVNAQGTGVVTWVSGVNFSWASQGQHINIAGQDYTIASVTSDTSLTLTTSAGTQTRVTYADPNLRGHMKPFQSELYFRAKAGGPDYNVRDAFNYVASLTQVEKVAGNPKTMTIDTWAGLLVGTPGPQGSAPGAVTNGYGILIQNLREDPPTDPTLQEANAAAIRIEGHGNYGRILWSNNSSISETDAGELQVTASPLTVSESPGTPPAPPVGFDALYFKSSDHQLYYRQPGAGGSEIGPLVDASRMPSASTSQAGFVTTGDQGFAGNKGFTGDVSVGGGVGVGVNIYCAGEVNAGSYTVHDSGGDHPGADGTFTTADGHTVTVKKGIITNIA